MKAKNLNEEVKKAKRTIKRFDATAYETPIFPKDCFMLSGYELISGTKKFLDRYYKDCFISKNVDYATRSLYVSLDGYAKFLKVIFVAVFARELIKIDINNCTKELTFDIKFNTELLTEENVDELKRLVDESAFSVEFEEGCVRAIFKYVSANFTMFNAISTNYVFSTLARIFEV